MPTFEEKFHKNIEEFMRQNKFIEPVNTLAHLAGYLGGDCITKFKRDILWVIIQHNLDIVAKRV